MTVSCDQRTIGQGLVVQCRDCGKPKASKAIFSIPFGQWKRVERGLSMTVGSVAVRSTPPSAMPRRRQSKNRAGRMPG
jgi:hypothetical protein